MRRSSKLYAIRDAKGGGEPAPIQIHKTKWKLDQLTRVEVVDFITGEGRICVWDHRDGPVDVDLSFQDGGRTLKIFVKRRGQHERKIRKDVQAR